MEILKSDAEGVQVKGRLLQRLNVSNVCHYRVVCPCCLAIPSRVCGAFFLALARTTPEPRSDYCAHIEYWGFEFGWLFPRGCQAWPIRRHSCVSCVYVAM